VSPESNQTNNDMREECDIRGGVRGKYSERYRRGTNLVLPEPDLAAVFPNSGAVNRALRVPIEADREEANGSQDRKAPNTTLQPTGSAHG